MLRRPSCQLLILCRGQRLHLHERRTLLLLLLLLLLSLPLGSLQPPPLVLQLRRLAGTCTRNACSPLRSWNGVAPAGSAVQGVSGRQAGKQCSSDVHAKPTECRTPSMLTRKPALSPHRPCTWRQIAALHHRPAGLV